MISASPSWRKRLVAPVLVLVSCASLAVAPAARAEDVTIALEGVPANLVLPLPAGTNEILTARVHGAPVRAVWLAAAPGASGRVVLTSTGEGEYAVNLADAAVAALLAAHEGPPQFQVFAEAEGGRVVGSVPVRYRVAPPSYSPAVDVVRMDGARDPYVAAWYDPSCVRAFEVHHDPHAAVRAVAGGVARAFTPGAGVMLHVLTLDDELRTAWQRAGELQVRVQNEGTRYEWTIASTRAVPSRLALAEPAPRFVVAQRSSAEVPGSGGYVSVALGDIQGPDVLVTLWSADGAVPGETQPMQRGSRRTLALREATYTLTLVELVNKLMGEDYCVFAVEAATGTSTAAAPADDPDIERLLGIIERSELRFVREGEAFDGAKTAAFLREKLAAAPVEARTLERFLTDIAGRSSTSGKPYLVELPDGTRVLAEQWLRAQARE